MESNFSNRDFEQYIKQNADQYRMFPSEKVWKGVNSALHTRRKWYGFWLGFLLLLTGGAVTWVMTTHPGLKKEDPTSSGNKLSFSPIDEHVNVPKSSIDIGKLLPFNKQPLVTGGLPISLKEQGTIEPSTTSIQDVPAIKRPLTHNQPFSEISADRDQSSIINIMVRESDDVKNAADEAVKEVSDQYVLIKKSPASTDHTQQSAYREGVFYPLTIESIINSYRYSKTPKKISWQLFITPTISYRKLSLNKSIDNPSAFNYPFASLPDVNSAVTHKPDIGLQIGLSGSYPITKNLKVRAGFQFNINRYDIKAYAFNGELATIDLNGSAGNSTISTWTNYRNYSGYRSDWLKSYYFSVAVPVGAELKLFGNAKTNVGIAGTLQPTYIISDNAYLISTDFKNYAEVPRLIRHVNLNTSFETFVNYSSGKTNWQIGPQVRYQLLSSFQNKYPVKENLFDFGVKVGVTLNN